jgi:hypothetical protein
MAILLVEDTLASQSINGTVYSTGELFRFAKGYTAMEIITTGAVTVTQQCSTDNVTYYDPVDYNGTALGAIASSVSSSSYIQFSPVISKYIRFKFVTTSAKTVSAKLISLEG